METTKSNRVEAGSIETQLFSWDGWDGEMESMVFYKPILKVQIGKHPAGTKFDSATVMWVNGILQLQNFGPEKEGFSEPVYTAQYNLKLLVGETINE